MTFNKLKHSLALISASALFCSCGDSPAEEGPQQVCRLTVTLDSGIGSTRSFDDDGLIDHVQMFLVTDSGATVPLTPSEMPGSSGAKAYAVDIDLNAAYVDVAGGLPTLSGRLAVVANHPRQVGKPFGNLEFQMWDAEEDAFVPMWGVTSIENLPLVAGASVDGGSISLIRAMAKINLSLDPAISSDFDITDIRALDDQFADEGFTDPRDAGAIKSTEGIDPSDYYNPVTTGSQSGHLKWSRHADGCYTTYLCEREATLADGNPSGFEVTLQQRNNPENKIIGHVLFTDYKGGTPAPGGAFGRIVRNHEYRYVIRLAPLGFLVTVDKWVFGAKVHIPLN